MALMRAASSNPAFHYLLSLSAGALLALPFLFSILFAVSWVALVPLFVALEGDTKPPWPFFSGWLAGLAANIIGFYWLDYTIRVFGGFPYGVSELIFLVFAACGALPLAFFALLARLAGYGPLHLYPAIFWVAIEFWSPLLFPWHLANSQAAFSIFIQSADLVGPYGASFLLMWFNTALSAALLSVGKERRASLRGAALLTVLVIAALLYGHWRLARVESGMKEAVPLKVAAIQGDIGIRHKWNVAYLESNLKAYQELTKESPGAQLVLWPETAVEAWLPENIRQLPAEILPALPPDAALIFGARSFRGDPATANVRVFNSAFLADSLGRVSGVYHKQVLLAFGEYLPFAALLSKLPGVPPLGDGFSRGEGPRTLDLPQGVKAAPLICYEDLMPGLARAFVAEKRANLLINLTNDAWFGDTVAPWQHARLAQWRAIETRRYLVRVTNTGLTSVIDPAGKIVEGLPLFAPGILRTEVKLMETVTPYVRFGDWFAWLATLAALAIVVWRCRSRLLASRLPC